MLPPDGAIEQTRQDWAIVALFHTAVPERPRPRADESVEKVACRIGVALIRRGGPEGCRRRW